VLWSLAALGGSACSATGAAASGLTPAGRAWRESFYENFALELSTDEAECLAGDVGELTRMVGPLVGQRPDDTATSVWASVDRCLSPASQGGLARAIVFGGWSADEPSLVGVWDSADDALLGCVQTAGGWTELGSYTALMATCGTARGEVQP
jgi:hypothetical protein